MDFVVFWSTLVGAAGLAWIAFLGLRLRTRRYAFRVLKGGVAATVIGALLYVVPALNLPGFGFDLLFWPLGPAFFAWGAIWPAALHFRYREAPWEEPL
jgi:hypothetical protein